MRLFRFAVLYTVIYTGLALGANAAGEDMAALGALRDGTMKKLVLHSEPQPVSTVSFVDGDGAPRDLSEFKGRYVLLNFWATWCAPCRKEMPTISALQTDFQGPKFEVVTIATGRNPLPALRKFFEEVNITNLPVFRDPTQKLARDMAVLGLPISVILDPDGNEIARLRGDADWNSDSARAIISSLIAVGDS